MGVLASGRFNHLGGASNFNQTRNYWHWWRCTPDEFELPSHSMPVDIKRLLADPEKFKKEVRPMDFYDTYWYWRLRKEATVLNPERLPKLSYKQLAYDMGVPVVNEALEHQVGLIELYEYLKSSPFIGPFGTIENPVLVPAIADIRTVACTGGTGDNEHVPLYFNCREGFLYRCGECDQIFMLVRVTYQNSWSKDYIHSEEIHQVDPDVDELFDVDLLAQGHSRWCTGGMVRWSTGQQALFGDLDEREVATQIAPQLADELSKAAIAGGEGKAIPK